MVAVAVAVAVAMAVFSLSTLSLFCGVFTVHAVDVLSRCPEVCMPGASKPLLFFEGFSSSPSGGLNGLSLAECMTTDDFDALLAAVSALKLVSCRGTVCSLTPPVSGLVGGFQY